MKFHREKRGVGTYKKKPLPISQAEEKANKEYELARAKIRQIKFEFGNTLHISLRDCLEELNHNVILYDKSIDRGLPSKDYKKKIYEGKKRASWLVDEVLKKQNATNSASTPGVKTV